MEHTHPTEGEHHEIITREYLVYTPGGPPEPPPTTFNEAERHNAYTLLVELYEHSLRSNAEGQPPDDPRHHLGELALSTAVVAWWSRWQPLIMHRALVAGASLADVAAAVGTSDAEAHDCWSRWADSQAELSLLGRPGVEADEVATIRARLAGQASPDPESGTS